jgi:hypothetical protein
LVIRGDHKDAKPTKILIAIIIELEKLQENKLEAHNNVGTNQWSIFLWNQQKHIEKKFQFGDYVFLFPKGEKARLGKFKKDGLVHLRYNISYPIISFFLYMLTILN